MFHVCWKSPLFICKYVFFLVCFEPSPQKQSENVVKAGREPVLIFFNYIRKFYMRVQRSTTKLRKSSLRFNLTWDTEVLQNLAGILTSLSILSSLVLRNDIHVTPLSLTTTATSTALLPSSPTLTSTITDEKKLKCRPEPPPLHGI